MVVCRMTLMKLRQALGGQVVLPDDWETTAEVIRETGRKDSIQRKRLAKKKWDMDRTEENRQEYKELQRRVKREVSKAKQKAYEELYTRLDTREGEKDLYRVLTSEESVQRRWKEYFEELMNEENEREKRVEGVNSVEQKVDKIRKDEVRKALKRMKSGKAVGPDDIPVEVWKCLGEAAVEFLANLFNRVLENLEKAYDRVPREELWYCMRKSGVAEKYVRVVQDMYERSRTVVRCAVGQTEEFNVEVGLHQGSALSPFLFAIVMDQLSEEVRQESPWTMMFADDIVICSESREQVEENLERWRFALERRGMKVSRSKTEYMCVNEREGSGTVRLQGEEVKKVQEFKYLGSTVQSNGECGKEVKKRVQAGWNGWRKVSGVLCDQKISARIKGKVYRTVVRPAMLYGLETVSLRKRQESELEVAELKMLRSSINSAEYGNEAPEAFHKLLGILLAPDLEKAYDRVPREELWYCMRKSGVAEKYVRVVQDMYERSRTVVRCAVGQTEEFNVEVGLHQGSALSPFLFAIVMDQLSEEVRQESPWTMMFADDIVICSESREQVEENLERWRFALERRGMKVSRSKTEYMCVNEREGSGTVRLQGEEVKKVQEFKYLGSTVQSNGECGKEVKKQVQAGWNGWRKVSGVLCDQKISARIKGKVYRTVVRPAMLYGLETVSLRKRQESELEVAELKMLRFSLGVTRLDSIRNEYIRGTAHVGRLGDKVREARLRWFGHVQRRDSQGSSPSTTKLPLLAN
ncbi:hypothetical protein QTP70_001283 [Hemibagrus guttatus]|uniref:ribonuclease H n=1 Tax=Hemibagrus guttatus TaxID=175788 RepID=A0AAE0Q6M6_9TELE|nr:hypothetical protein QTP70_001283 [Hemibagrus guttatus]